MAVLGPGQCFIVAAVLIDRVYLKSARALTAARVLLLPAELLRRHFAEDAALARRLAVALALACRAAVKGLKNQTLRSSLERLANGPLHEDAVHGGSGRFALPFDERVRASRLGMAPEVLSRAVATLRHHGVSVDGPAATLADRPARTRLAAPSATIDDRTT